MFEYFDHLNLATKPESLALGRRLYTFKYHQQDYWLKLQLQHSNVHSQASFEHELRVYRQLGSLSDFALPVQLIEVNDFLSAELHQFGIMLPHANIHFMDQVSHLTLLEMQQYIERALLTLGKLHLSGWVHGDLKTEHFVCYQQRVCLIDFEQCQRIDAVDSAIITATPHYMAPELFHGSHKSIQSDLYALGIILYEWLIGRRLSASNYMQWAILHCQKLKIELPLDRQCFTTLLQGLLSKHPKARFQDTNQALKALHLTKMPI